MMNDKLNLFLDSLDKGKNAYVTLASTYSEMVVLVNKLNNRIKKQMQSISYIEEGFNSTDEAESFERIGELILVEINTFNLDIVKSLELFKTCIKDSIYHYNKSLEHYNRRKSELTHLIKARKTILFLEALMRKFKNKVSIIQNGLNILPSFNEEMKVAKKEFAKKVKSLIVELNMAEELCLSTVDLMEEKIQQQ